MLTRLILSFFLGYVTLNARFSRFSVLRLRHLSLLPPLQTFSLSSLLPFSPLCFFIAMFLFHPLISILNNLISSHSGLVECVLILLPLLNQAPTQVHTLKIFRILRRFTSLLLSSLLPQFNNPFAQLLNFHHLQLK